MSRPIQIVPSVLPADFARLGEEVAALEAAGVDHIQWDVMDGQFVPNLTFGPDVIAAARRHTTLPFEAHLMVLTPDVMAQQYIDGQRAHGGLDHLHAIAGFGFEPACQRLCFGVVQKVDLVHHDHIGAGDLVLEQF